MKEKGASVEISEASNPSSWYAVRVRSRHEKSVAAQLEAKQYEVFLPLYHSRRRWADRWKSLSLPLFPNYVFCRFNPSTRSGLLATSGIIDLVRVGPEPAPIQLSEIHAIKRAVSSPLTTGPYPDLVTGRRVKLRDGPLKGVIGTIIEVRESIRLVISIELLQRSIFVEIDPAWAEAL